MMQLEIGVPGSGTTVVLDAVGDQLSVEEKVVAALNVLKIAGDTWQKWSRENETPEQTEMRELVEKNTALQKRALAKQNADLEAMLNGTAE